MVRLQDIHSLSDFQRNTKEHIDRLTETGQPEVLTINGKARLVVQDAQSYQKLIDELDHVQSVAAIKRALESQARGKGRPMREFLEELGRKHGIELKK
jgi:PHD/YefM family antitoxin component YafN of YafNO toxin-antitoxin module